MASRRRLSISFCGLPDEDVERLRENDLEFYGSDSSGTSDSGTDDEGLDAPPPTKRPHASSSDEVSGEENTSGSGESDREEAHCGYIAAKIHDLKKQGCDCEGKSHYEDLATDELEELIFSLETASKWDKKIFVMGKLSAGLRSQQAASRQRSFTYKVLGVDVCRKAFCEVHGLGHHTLRSLQEHVEAGLIVPPLHKLTGRPAKHAVSESVKHDITMFIRNYASSFGMPQPAAPRGTSGVAPTYLPASLSILELHRLYCDANPEGRVGRDTFRRVWLHTAKDVIIMKRRTDVCDRCDKFREKMRAAKTEEALAAASQELEVHLTNARDERTYYNDIISVAKDELHEAAGENRDPAMTHLTCDYAQQIELPFHTRQVGPLYFKSRFKVQLFGVCNEAARQQRNYLFHEGQCIGQDGKKSHGPNSVLSILNDYIANSGEVGDSIYLQADNCVGQNKNKSVIAYLLWLTLTGRSTDIHLSFMAVGHTRCTVDGYFGLLKQKVRSSDLDTMEQVEAAVNSCSTVNEAKLYSWEWREWDDFLARFFRPVRGIAKFHHFRVDNTQPGRVFMEAVHDAEEERNLFRDNVTVDDVIAPGLPPIIPVAGISEARIAYLQKEIRHHMVTDITPPWE